MSATDEKPIPIHLGELLKNEPIPQGGTKKIIATFPDHRDILYPKALMSVLSGA